MIISLLMFKSSHIYFGSFRPLHGELHQGEPSRLNQGVPESVYQPHSEWPVCRLHPQRCPRHEESRPCPSCNVGRMCTGEMAQLLGVYGTFICSLSEPLTIFLQVFVCYSLSVSSGYT